MSKSNQIKPKHTDSSQKSHRGFRNKGYKGKRSDKNAATTASLADGLSKVMGHVDVLEQKLFDKVSECKEEKVPVETPKLVRQDASRNVLEYKIKDWLDDDYDKLEQLGARCELHFATENPEKALNRALVRMPLWLEKDGHPLPDTRSAMRRMINYVSNFGNSVQGVTVRYTEICWWKMIGYCVNLGLLWKKPSRYTLANLMVYSGLVGLPMRQGVKQMINGDCEIMVIPTETVADYCTGFLSEGRKAFKETKHSLYAKVGNFIKLPTWPSRAKCLEHVYYVGYSIASNRIWFPRSCFHNELRSLVTRQLTPPVGCQIVRTKILHDCRDALLKEMDFKVGIQTRPYDELYEEFVSRYPGSRKRMLEIARAEKDSVFHVVKPDTKMFVKGEWCMPKDPSKRDPRCISGKRDDFLLHSGPHFHDYWNKVCAKYWPDPWTAVKQKFIYTGKMTADEIGLVITILEQDGWKAKVGDFKRFDGHVEIECLTMEASIHDVEEFVKDELLKLLKTKGTSVNGIQFEHVAKRASGVINTGSGNTTVTNMLYAGFFAFKGIKEYKVMAIGDDHIPFTRVDFDSGECRDFMFWAGHLLDLEDVHDYDFLTYCSSRAWDCGDQRVLGPKPGRVLSKTFVSSDPAMRRDQLADYVRQIAIGMRYYEFVPVLGKFIKNIAERVVTDKRYRKRIDWEYKVQLRTRVDFDSETLYNQFVKIYGFSPASLEHDLDNFDYKLGVSLESVLLDIMVQVDC